LVEAEAANKTHVWKSSAYLDFFLFLGF